MLEGRNGSYCQTSSPVAASQVRTLPSMESARPDLSTTGGEAQSPRFMLQEAQRHPWPLAQPAMKITREPLINCLRRVQQLRKPLHFKHQKSLNWQGRQ